MWKIRIINPTPGIAWHGQKGDLMIVADNRASVLVGHGVAEYVEYQGKWPYDPRQIAERIKMREDRIRLLQAEIAILKKRVEKPRGRVDGRR
jgi:hypothetical protein